MPECVDAWGAMLKRFPPSSFLRPPPLLPLPVYSLSNVPVYRWDVDDVDKRILHSLGFFWSWFVTVTVTVWKNKIRVRHASLGELRQQRQQRQQQKNSVSWITIRTDMLAVFTETQIKSNHLKGSATRKDKLLLGRWCWGENIIIYFSNPLLDEYRRWNRFVVACLILRDVVSVCRARGETFVELKS